MSIPKKVSDAVKYRSGGVCEHCKIRLPAELHHRLPRSRGGKHDEFNLVYICSPCHHEVAHQQYASALMIPGRMNRGYYEGPNMDYGDYYNQDLA